VPKTLPLTEAKAKLSELVGEVADQQERVVVTRNGRPAAVLISPDDLESLEETLAVLADPELLARVRQGLAEADASQGRPLEKLLAEHRRERA
jgi:prevent-host-death family protein